MLFSVQHKRLSRFKFVEEPVARARAEEGENAELSGVTTGGLPMVEEGNRTGVGVAGKSGPV